MYNIYNNLIEEVLSNIMNQRYAGFWIRFVAVLIDGILIGLINWVIGLLLQNTLGDAAANIALVISIGLSIGYYVVYQEKQGQTIGKKAMKIKVVTYDGKTPTMFTFFLREIIGKMISAVILLLGYLMVIWDKKKQGLHDKITNTYVVYVEPAAAQQAAPIQQQAVPPVQQPIEKQPMVPTPQTVVEPQQPV